MSAPQQGPFERPTGLGGPPPESDEIGGWFKHMEFHTKEKESVLNARYIELYEEMTKAGWPKMLKEILERPEIKYFQALEIKGCVCIGIGSFARDLVPIAKYPNEDYWDDNTGIRHFRSAAEVHRPHRNKSMYRLIFLVMLVKLLEPKHNPIPIYIYDQSFFGRADKNFLERRFQVVHSEHTKTAGLVDPATLYYAPGASADVVQTVLERCSPAVFIGPSLPDLFNGIDDPTGRLPIKQLLESYINASNLFLGPPFNYKIDQESKALGHDFRWLRYREQRKAWIDFRIRLPDH